VKPKGSPVRRPTIAANSLVEKLCLHVPGCHPFRDLSGSGGSASIITCWLRRYLSAPSPKKCLLPFHLGPPSVSAVVLGSGFALILSYWLATVHLRLGVKRGVPVRLLAALHRSSHLGRVGLDLMAAPPASDDQADLRRRSAAEHRGRTVEDFIAASDGLQSQLPRINFDTT